MYMNVGMHTYVSWVTFKIEWTNMKTKTRMYAHMYACMHACMYVCMYVCIMCVFCAYVYVWWVRMWIYLCIYVLVNENIDYMTYAYVDFNCDNSDHEGSDSHLPGHKELQAWGLTGLKLLFESIQGFRVEGFRVHPKLYLALDIFRPPKPALRA